MKRSKYDLLHDRYFNLLNSKAGTRYERLAAVTFKSLYEHRRIIHDLRLIGASSVKHQIDVVMDGSQGTRRVLIECKDFDVQGKKVGLGILRDFRSVVEEIGPDEAYVITCEGFTRDARLYAAHHGIKLAVLREFRDPDWEGRIRTIQVTQHLKLVDDIVPRFSMSADDAAKCERWLAAAGLSRVGKTDPVYVVTVEGQFQLNDFVNRKANAFPRDVEGDFQFDPLEGMRAMFRVENQGEVPLEGLPISLRISHAEDTFEVTASSPALLLLQPVGDSDLVVFEDGINNFRITEAGEVVKLG